MSFVSILLPAFYFDDNRIEQRIMESMHLERDQFEICELSSLENSQSSAGKREYAIKLINSDFNLPYIEGLLEETRSLRNKLEKSKESLAAITNEYKYILSNPTVQTEIENQKTSKRAKKLKSLKEDNKKLRQLLKAQLENSEKMRVETQTTVETLREEFDLLVRELSNLQKKDQSSQQGENIMKQIYQLKQEKQQNPNIPNIQNIDLQQYQHKNNEQRNSRDEKRK